MKVFRIVPGFQLNSFRSARVTYIQHCRLFTKETDLLLARWRRYQKTCGIGTRAELGWSYANAAEANSVIRGFELREAKRRVKVAREVTL